MEEMAIRELLPREIDKILINDGAQAYKGSYRLTGGKSTASRLMNHTRF